MMNTPSPLHELLNISPYKAESEEEYMNDRQREHFSILLKKWYDHLLSEASKTVVSMRERIVEPDTLDQASDETKFRSELRHRDRERKLLKKISKSISDIHAPDSQYGFCDECGVKIGLARLEARPTADYCVDCKGLMELKEDRD